MTDTLIAKANTGEGIDQLAVDNVPGGAAGVVKIALGAAGAVDGFLSAGSPMPVSNASLTAIAGTVQTHDTVAAVNPTGQLLLAVRRDANTSQVSADGDYSYLTTNEDGRLKVASAPAQLAPVTGSITGNGQNVAADVSSASNVMVYCTGTFSGINCAFEGSLDGTNWFSIQGIRTNANTIETTTGVLAAAPIYAWELSVNACSNFRVRSTAFTSGAQQWRFLLGTYATEPIPGAQVTATQSVSGTVTATISAPALPTASIVSSAATANATVVKATAGTIYSVTASNTGASAAFLKLHNSATVTAGTTAVAMTIPIPASSVLTIPFGSQGMRYGTGICISITNLAADNDTTAVALAQVKVNTSFI